jgi:hypothetical protein
MVKLRLAIGLTMVCVGTLLLSAESTSSTSYVTEVAWLALGLILLITGFRLSKDTIDKYHL